jgi:hypothetical protein
MHPTDEETTMSTRTHVSTLSAALATVLCFPSLPALAGDFPAGTYADADFTLAFDGNGHFRGSQKGATKVEGSYTVQGDQLQFTDSSGPWACPAAQKGTYGWKAEGSRLTFSKDTDACKDRVDSLTPHAWTRQG